MRIEQVLARLDGVKPSGGGFIARCPSHEDKTQSLFVSEDRGLVLVYCYAGCAFAEIVHAMGLRIRDMFPDDGSVTPHWDGFAGTLIEIDRAMLQELLVAEMAITARLNQLDRRFIEQRPEKKMPKQLMDIFELEEREKLAYRRISELAKTRNRNGR